MPDKQNTATGRRRRPAASGSGEPPARSASVSRERLIEAPAPRRARTPPRAEPIEDARPELPGGELLAERMKQLRYLQDFFHNPVPFDLRDQPLDSSSPPEEIVRRMGEVQYQIDVLKALLVVFNEELEALDNALPPGFERRLKAAQT